MMPANLQSILGRLPYARPLYVQFMNVYVRLRYHAQLKKRTPIIVYQVGKVGSSSVLNSLVACGVQPVFHTHWLHPSSIQRVRQRILARDPTSPYPTWFPWLLERLHRDIVAQGRQAKFITLVRDPIARSISNFFSNFSRFTGIAYEEAKLSIEELVPIFLERCNHSAPSRWFDEEVKTVLGIDVYDYPFPKEEGHLTIKKGSFELLILKTEVDDSVKEGAIGEFIGLTDFRLTRSNVGQHKGYAATYAEFKGRLELPEAYVEPMCNSRYMRHFYSDHEIDRISSRWRRKTSRTELPPAVYAELPNTLSGVAD